MSKNVLDFLIIGAQKSGTTSLFAYMASHPQLYMPPEKESPFFSDDEKVARGWQWYIAEYFGDAPPDRLWGKATPQYMIYPGVPERIKATLPDVKLIAVLRHPVERAYSDYRMNVQRGYEKRDFETAVYELLQPEALAEARARPARANTYLTSGEYGRILAAYCELFPRENISVFFTEELRQKPEWVLRSIFEFLGVDSTYVPPNLGAVYRKGGSRRRLPGLDYRHLKEVRFLRLFLPVWHALLPMKVRRRFWYWLDLWNVAPDKKSEQMPTPSVKERLATHYEADMKHLASLIGREVPWSVTT